MELYSNISTKKGLIQAKASDKKAVHKALADAAKALEAAFSQIVKAEDKQARNVANAAKGRYQSVANLVASCFPYQSADGRLARKIKADDGRKFWAEKAVTASAARGIVRASIDNFIKTYGQTEGLVAIVEFGAEAE